jgi:ubiquinone/menaquinone biosynthesis C-methylase UbiE
MPNYGDPKYWENRYKNSKSTFDWLEDYNSLKSIISDLIPEENKKYSTILNLGCGNSLLCEEMYDDGYKNIINIDLSETVIKYMQNRNKEIRKKLKFFVMDCRELNINNNSIDLAIDKSTIDALLCGENSFINVAKMLKEVQRVLKIGGYYLMISYGCPENRLIHIERKFLGFDIKIFKIVKNEKVEISSNENNNKDNNNNKNNIDDNNNFESSHYVYICKKKTNADYLSNKYYKTILNELENQSDFEKDITGTFSNKEKLQELINLICKKEKEKKIVENGSENNSEIEISETISNKNNNSEYTYHYKYNNDSSNLSSSKTNDKNKKNSKYYSNSGSSY